MGFLQLLFLLLLIVYTNSDVYTCINDVQTQKISNVQDYIEVRWTKEYYDILHNILEMYTLY